MSVSILGFGEVGSALYQVYREKNIKPKVLDPYKNKHDDISSCSVLNVCIPCKQETKFVNDVVNSAQLNTNLKLIIIHSSILLGIVEKLHEKLEGVHVVHSPIRGVHPNLYEGIKTFAKFVGHMESDPQGGELAKKHLESIGLKTIITTNKTTILLKLLSTTYYGMCIAFTEDMGRICDKENIDFNMISEWTSTYNNGYRALGKENVMRPDLFRIEDGKHIGGHCVIPNTELLKKMYPDMEAWEYILRYK
jgi:UDP-N-acetyl-D-mannosaminuronate dehydrogenase